MKFIETAKIYGHLISFLATQNRYNLSYHPGAIDRNRFITAAEAAKQIPDGSTVISVGMGGHARCSILFRAIRNSYLKDKTPKNLTWMTVSAQGGRGKAPGTVEEVAVSGLIKEYISGHVETAHKQLEMGANKEIEIHILPQGEITQILHNQSEGNTTSLSEIGIGTFLDPDLGGNTAATPHSTKSYVKKNGDLLEYSLPKIDVALFNAPYADSEGNIYFKNASAITEIREAALAANYNGGKVIATVSKIIEKDETSISLSSKHVTHIVVNPANEQTASIKQKKYWPMFTEGAKECMEKSIAKMNTINKITSYTPKRGPVENVLARMAASLFVKVAQKGNLVNLGIGLPEEVGRLVYEGGLFDDFTFSSETGVYGGLPASGLFFGGAINPQKMYSSAWIFNHYKTSLDITVLGTLQVDSKGNVNVSKRGEGVKNYVGPGGFMNIADSAKTIIFIGSWMAKAEFKLKDGKLTLIKKGIPKFVDEVLEVTFNAKAALKRGKTVYYVTTVGIFKLTEKGPELIQVMPGIDVKKDILEASTAKIQISENLELVPESITTGNGYKLAWD
ncbi:CoA-transferase [Desulfobotulus mexicanus]|uniref:Uncharacterized protein n=1 Tax=Desulfobotulus mexicanus TaxID=2586642 RepID=A0A5S5MCW7_9BACT|nr:CoA-transferase [Desulfobotulus mexicanus]TYT73563.1 hypothetical protein FIM25_14640 [Desulfobotulus mexicanus]